VKPRRVVEQSAWQAVPAMCFEERSGFGLNALLGVIRCTARNNHCMCCFDSMLLSGEPFVEFPKEHCSSTKQHPEWNTNGGSQRRDPRSLTTKCDRRYHCSCDAKSRWEAAIVPSEIFQCQAD